MTDWSEYPGSTPIVCGPAGGPSIEISLREWRAMRQVYRQATATHWFDFPGERAPEKGLGAIQAAAWKEGFESAVDATTHEHVDNPYEKRQR